MWIETAVMLEAIVEGGGVLAGLALLLYFQVLRPDSEAARARAAQAAADAGKRDRAERGE